MLRSALKGVGGWLHLEFDIPRLGRRVDAVLVTHTAVLPIEFKVGAKNFNQLDYEQAARTDPSDHDCRKKLPERPTCRVRLFHIENGQRRCGSRLLAIHVVLPAIR